MRSWNCPVPPLTVFQISAAFLFFSSISLHLFLLFILPQRPQRLPGQREQYHEVEHGHQSDADIAEVPDDCVGLKTADKQHDQGEDLRKLIRDDGRSTPAEIIRDLPGKDRVVKCEIRDKNEHRAEAKGVTEEQGEDQ